MSGGTVDAGIHGQRGDVIGRRADQRILEIDDAEPVDARPVGPPDDVRRMEVAQHQALFRRGRAGRSARPRSPRTPRALGVGRLSAAAARAGTSRAAARLRSSSRRGRRAGRGGMMPSRDSADRRGQGLSMQMPPAAPRRPRSARRPAGRRRRGSCRCRDPRSAGSPGRDPAHRFPERRNAAARAAARSIATKARDRLRAYARSRHRPCRRAPAGRAPAAASPSGCAARVAVGATRLVGAGRGIAGQDATLGVAASRASRKSRMRQRAAMRVEGAVRRRRSSPAGLRRHASSSTSTALVRQRRRRVPAIRPGDAARQRLVEAEFVELRRRRRGGRGRNAGPECASS